MILAELDFGQTVAAGALSTVLSAVVVTLGAGLIVKYYEMKAAGRRQAAEAREAERRRKADELFADRIRSRELEYQTRAALRETYAQLLIAQRRSRQASAKVEQAGIGKADESLTNDAVSAHDEFITCITGLV